MSGARRERVERRRDGGTVEEEEADGGSGEPSGEERDGTVSGGTGKEGAGVEAVVDGILPPSGGLEGEGGAPSVAAEGEYGSERRGSG